MENDKMPFTPPGGAFLVSRETYERMVRLLSQIILPDQNDFENHTKNGKTFFRLRDRRKDQRNSIIPPLWVFVGKEEGSAVWKAWVNAGYFCDISVVTEPWVDKEIDGVTYDILNPILHTVNENQAIYVKAVTNEKGAVTQDPVIFIGPKNYDWDHYEPKAGEYSGASGEDVTKLAEFELIDDALTVKPIKMGDNIFYNAHRPPMINLPADSPAGAVYNLLKSFNGDNDEYQFRPLKQLEGLEAEPLILPPTGDPLLRNDIPIRRIGGRLASAGGQIRVVPRPGDPSVAEVIGNGKNGRVLWQNCNGGTPVVLLQFQDGQVITEGDITITAGCPITGTP